MNKPSIAALREALAYDRIDGTLRWKWRADVGLAWNRRCAGKIAGTIDHDGYRLIRFNSIALKSHRIIWALCTGRWPKGEIDHINGDPADNRLENLRDVTRAQNRQNIAGWRGKALPLGVQRRCDGKAFIAKIMLARRFVHLGSFATPELAHAAYLKASHDLRGEYARAR